MLRIHVTENRILIEVKPMKKALASEVPNLALAILEPNESIVLGGHIYVNKGTSRLYLGIEP